MDLEELQAEVTDLESLIIDCVDHVGNAASCETASDCRANLTELKLSLQAALTAVSELLST